MGIPFQLVVEFCGPYFVGSITAPAQKWDIEGRFLDIEVFTLFERIIDVAVDADLDRLLA